ncbi:MAG: radical SAM protein, partial [Methanocorpusculum sp.]|nr:radical SAM protein [Methanocorpusculum sp.]
MSELTRKIEAATRSPFFDQSGRTEGKTHQCHPLKILLEGTCSFDCRYCEICTKKKGISFTPEEMAHGFLELYREGRVGGLLLSTGIPRGDVDLGMERLTETARLIRSAGFNGYLHLKVLPGANRSDIAELAKYATRLSINLEAPSASYLSELASVKDYSSDLLTRHKWLAEIMPGKHSTQFVVGAADETDRDIFSTVMTSYEKYSPARVYYSAFHAISETPLETHENTPLWRANRWYQVDALLRLYGYTRQETSPVFDDDGMLMNTDPKVLLARTLPEVNPTDAVFEELLRVPGIGPVSARNIIRTREKRNVKNPAALKDCGVIL